MAACPRRLWCLGSAQPGHENTLYSDNFSQETPGAVPRVSRTDGQGLGGKPA